jgi:hypothetical protein
MARQFGVRALRYAGEVDAGEFAEIVTLVRSGKVRLHVQRPSH